jgi:hypothetical protein
MNYYGEYTNGWWNSIWGNLNQKKPENVTLNYGSDNKCYYVTPLTSSNNNDASMTDLIYTDTRTGISKRYIVTGSTETTLMNAVTSKLSYQHLHGEHIIYENVYGRMTAIVSVLGEDGSYRGVAFIDVANKSTIAYDPIPLNAIHIYQSLISQNGEQIATDNATDAKTITAIVKRLNFEQTTSGQQLDLYFANYTHAFYVNCASYPDATFTEKGDSVTITYYNTPASGISVTNFHNKAINIVNSENQTAAIEHNTSTANKEKTKANANDIRGMTDEQLDSMRKK